MGVFDWLRVKMPLPDGTVPPDRYDAFQTKDTDAQWLEKYTITEDGRLVYHSVQWEETPKQERPYPDDEGILGLAGCIRGIPTGDVEIPFHGDLDFCSSYDNEFRDYTARFTEGRCVRIIRNEYGKGN